jgi:hypothetical protein
MVTHKRKAKIGNFKFILLVMAQFLNFNFNCVDKKLFIIFFAQKKNPISV